MHIQSLRLINFKNWPELELSLNTKLNCFVGKNGSGKTNILDAIHYISVCKSYFNSIDSQNIMDDAPFFVIEGNLEKDEHPYAIYCGVKKGQKKTFKKNKKEYEKLADHIGSFPSVMISPYDRDLIVEGSETRRKFMNAVVSQSDPLYLNHIISYNKVLQQRNALLKYFAANHTFDKESLDIYTRQLDEKGALIYEQRKAFTEVLSKKLQYYYQLIADGAEVTHLQYKSQLEDETLEDLLEQNIDKDRAIQYTSAGIHKDDLLFSIAEKPLKKFGSQGQQKSFLIALKLAQYDFIAEKQGVKPLLLLDDIFDKLDEQRVAQLVKLVHNEAFGQIFITDTHRDRTAALVKKISDSYSIFTVDKGNIVDEEK